MAQNWKANTMRSAWFGVLALIAFPLFADTGDTFVPNYADRMLTPVEGTNIAPRLVASRRHFPIRVVVMNDFYCNDRYFAAVKQACEAWVTATKKVPGGGIRLTCEQADDPAGADVVIRVCSREQSCGFSGFTNEYGAWALIRLSAFDANSNHVSAKDLKRVAMHEFGHALGIWGHSPDPNDIMSVDEKTTEISIADVNTLKLAYAGENPQTRLHSIP